MTALVAGGYYYVTGGQVMETDNAYVQAATVGVSTDVSGIVKEVEVTENGAEGDTVVARDIDGSRDAAHALD